ncbi:MAG: hypothetical protein KDA36_01210, partial [Planctomycetaceae bacterium]|nr:hypothetical protein [Planctomycetaceae bacterium]
GENCWEYYPGGGVNFLRKLYHRIAKHPKVTAERVCDYLEKYPATDKISHLFAGSWIQHNFAIWIGHPECNRAWDLLHEARAHFMKAAASGKKTKKQIAQAQRELDIAEGSDWFWWFGDDHSSEQDGLFDQLFRKHLQNVYTILGAPFPTGLSRPISRLERRVIHTVPKGFLNVKVDGRRTYFEWLDAGHYVSGNERGTMTLVADSLIREVYFGFDLKRLMLRIDTAVSAKRELAHLDELRIGFLEPEGYYLRIMHPSSNQPELQLYNDNIEIAGAVIEYAIDSILEVTIRFEDLHLKADDQVQLFIEAFSERNSVDRAPREGALELLTPSADFEQVMWQA